MRRIMATAVVLLFTLALASGCGDEEKPATDTTSTKSIDITFSDGTVTPNGERVDVAVGQKITLVVKADEAGELHVHSTPESELEYGEGTTTLTLTIDKPGVVDIESHNLEQVIVQLEVS